MSTDLVLLAFLMFLVTYPTRALGLLTPGLDRLPKVAFDYLRLVGPAVLAALAAVSVMVVVGDDDVPSFHVGIEWVAVFVCLRDRGPAAQPVPRAGRRGRAGGHRPGGRAGGAARLTAGPAGRGWRSVSPVAPPPRSRSAGSDPSGR